MHSIILETEYCDQIKNWTMNQDENPKPQKTPRIEKESQPINLPSFGDIAEMECKASLNQDVHLFFSGNPIVEIIKGKVHLYKREASVEMAMITNLPSHRSKVVMVLAVPSYMSLSEFVLFLGAFTKTIKHIRVLRDNSPNRYMLLILFRVQNDANAFYMEFNGKNYSSMTPEVCHTAFVWKVEFVHPKNSPLWPPTGQTELPNCTICLEKLDASVSGLLTIVCNHSFHCDCLARWRDENRCPICRYTQTPSGEHSLCSDCGIEVNLWICLVCGYIGCSRYKNKHSEEHFLKTKHTYAMELDSQRVWDYTRDAYVHRLAANQSDGKLVEIPDFNWELELANTIKQKDTGLGKGEALELEWQYLLEAQLETQKRFFEERISILEKQTRSKINYLEQEFAQLLHEKIETSKRMEDIERHKKTLEKKTNELEKKMSEVSKETDFLKEINGAMEKNQTNWKKKIVEAEEKLKEAEIQSAKDDKIRELEDQVRDLMFYIEAQKELASKSEFVDGEVVVVQSPQHSSTSPRSGLGIGKGQRGGRKKKK